MAIINPVGSKDTAVQIARKLETLSGTDRFDAGYIKNNVPPIATSTVLGGVKISNGIQVDANGVIAIKLANGLKFDASNNVVIDGPNIDVTTLNKADTLVSGTYQGGLSGASTLATLANANKGNWWNVSSEVTLDTTTFYPGDQLWCRNNITGTPPNIAAFTRVPASVAQATITTFGTVKLGNVIPLKNNSSTGVIGTSLAMAREDHIHPTDDFSIKAFVLANAYVQGDIVSNNNLYWKANANIPANTSFLEGTSGATWKILSFPVRHDSTLAVGRFGIDATGIYFEDGLTI